jgi:hypothetical protein
MTAPQAAVVTGTEIYKILILPVFLFACETWCNLFRKGMTEDIWEQSEENWTAEGRSNRKLEKTA